ncbi:MAG: helix-turn-helix transcriptional regulator [Armatimonadota bacterium]|nr:helix-turn-helix transcriptional regulator [Armatimonadota bacterium]MDR7425831.1 helix-turn-helix transcriptional regulator [Armatimonadota bacterium]MDR7442741.1 helix-turn-helix transcriptional regulator [Armatimonadota bacterium]MDR7462979.1 helix-turn-helix transcriptional regulator [Armatimonadota bacterium]MDR7515084.1 helix-turn-helix transcriptional regulator [Armatimonadota bacterium]
MGRLLAEVKKSFGLRVHEARTSAGLSQRELARALGLRSAVAVGDWERGKAFPKFETFLRLCEVLNKPPAFFLEGYTEPPRDDDPVQVLERLEQRMQQRHLELLHRLEQLPAEVSGCLPPDEVARFLDSMDFERDVLPNLPLDVRGALRARKLPAALEDAAYGIARNAAWHAWEVTREAVRAWLRRQRRP